MPPQRSIATNVAFNLFGQLAPALAAAVSMPWLLRGLGAERLGVLSLAWVAVGAFTLLDFGLGRSLTLEVARRRALGASKELAPIVQGTAAVLLAIGAACGGAILAAQHAVLAWLSVPADLAPEATRGLLALALTAPAMTVAAGLRAALEACGRFDLSNAVRAPMGALTYLGPAAVLPFTTSVGDAVVALCAGRVAGAVVMLWLTAREIPGVFSPAADWQPLRTVLASGWWINVATMAGVALSYADRVLLGRLVPLDAVAHYATPQELVSKLTVAPVAVNTVLLPAMSAASASGDAGVVRHFRRGLTYSFLLLLPIVTAGAALAPEWLAVWLGAETASASARAAQWLLLAVFLQSLAITPLTTLQAVGLSKVTAVLQFVQLPLLLTGLWVVVPRYGIGGAAFVAACRMLLDLCLLLWTSRRRVDGMSGAIARWTAVVAASVTWFGVLAVLPGLGLRLTWLVVAIVAAAWAAPQLIDADDLALWRSRLGRRSGLAAR